MNKKLIFALVVITMMIWCSSSVLAAIPKAEPVPLGERITPAPLSSLLEGASCRLQNDVGTYYYIWGNAVGDGYANYFDPALCGAPTYPFGIDSVEFVLTDNTPTGGNPPTWPLDVRVSIYSSATDICLGNQTLLCSEVYTIQQSEVGTIEKALSQTCCVTGPFFVSLTLESGTDFQPNTSQTFSNHADSCKAWAYWTGVWTNWSQVAVTFGTWVGYPCIRVIGKTKHSSCLSLDSLYWKPSYPDYAPNGMPDLDQHQDNWYKYETSTFSFCGPVAIANCFKWFDSKYNVPPGLPGDGMDMFPLVREYIDALGGMLGPYDDHDPFNMNHQATPWLFGGTPPPPPTIQPFMPGHQNPGMPPWGELVERLAWYFDTDGVRTQYCSHSGTNILDMQQGILMWFESEHFPNGSTLADTLCEKTWQIPTFEQVGKLVEKSEDVILLLGFWWMDDSMHWMRCGGHYVTVAGINRQDHLIAISDPAFDNAEMGAPGIVGDGLYITHSHGSHDATVHNDEGNVSHDIYSVNIVSAVIPQTNDTIGLWILPNYPLSLNPAYCYDFSLQNIPDEFVGASWPWPGGYNIATVVEYAVDISPWDYRGDVNIIPNGDGVVDIGDVVFLINYLFKHGSAPVPFMEGDTNCDGNIEVGDVVFLINYLFKNGTVPKCCD